MRNSDERTVSQVLGILPPCSPRTRKRLLSPTTLPKSNSNYERRRHSPSARTKQHEAAGVTALRELKHLYDAPIHDSAALTFPTENTSPPPQQHTVTPKTNQYSLLSQFPSPIQPDGRVASNTACCVHTTLGDCLTHNHQSKPRSAAHEQNSIVPSLGS